MKTEIVFKLEKNPDGFNQTFSPNCKVNISSPDGVLYLNYEKRAERVVGFYKNLRQEGEVILADVELHNQVKLVEDRIEYAIEGSIVKKNENNEVEEVNVKGVGALMHNKF